jgi:hypothetical protein
MTTAALIDKKTTRPRVHPLLPPYRLELGSRTLTGVVTLSMISD